MSLTPEQLARLSPQEKRDLLRQLLQQKKESQVKTYPLSFAQQRLWFLEQYESGSAVYNIPRAVVLRGVLQTAVLQHALNELITRHETLRTTFATVAGQPVQQVAPTNQIEINVIDVAETADPAPFLMAEARAPFNLLRGPLLRVTLLKRTETHHILLLTLHHLIADGWSMSIFTRELAALYQTFTTPHAAANLPPLVWQYGEFAQQQQQWLQSDSLQKQLRYWREQLNHSPALLQLPSDYPRPALQTFDGATWHTTFPPTLAQAIKQFSQQEGVTLFMTLLAAFKLLLARYTQQSDIVVGTPSANRTRRDVEGLIGLFVNTLVLRTDVSVAERDTTAVPLTFRALLQRVRQTVLGALTNQEVPFERLVEELQPERTLSHHPLFQMMFILQNAGESDIKLPGLTVTPLQVESGTAKFDLTLSLRETADSLTASFEYNTHLFQPVTIQRMAGHYQVLLAAAVAHPDTPILQLPLLTPAERQQLLVTWNQTTADFPPLCLHQLIEQQVQYTPQKIAAVFAHRSLTYQQLNQQANHLAHTLQQQGIAPGHLVGIQMERSLEMLITLLGILKTGAAYVPLDPAFPADRLAYMAQDAQLRLVIDETQYAALTSLPPAPFVPSPCSPDNTAYVIYTSGSTGKPKGVEVLHRGVVNFLTAMQQQPGITADDKLLAVTTLSFDIAGLELFLPLSVGAQVIIASHAQQTDGNKLLQIIGESAATMMQATPATWQMLLDAGWANSPRLDKILCGGEALPHSLAHELLHHCYELWNLYGPTETTIWSTCGRYQPPAISQQQAVVSVGRPIANTHIYILDNQMQPVPVGVAGELYIGGAGLAKGYLNQPHLTAEQFMPVEVAGNRLYKTGDLARYRADGQIEFLGRADFQVKVRGFRIELGEIEAALAKHTAVRQAVVIAREDAPGDKRLVAYLLATAVSHPSPAELRHFLQQTLPDYMLPAAFVWLESYPLTPNGKINRLGLPMPGKRPIERETAVLPPRDTLELQLVQVWQELLNQPIVSVNDNFFDLGGHSLLAMRLMAKVEKEIGRSLPLATLFQNQTVEQLAIFIRQGERGGKGEERREKREEKVLLPLAGVSGLTPFFLVHPVGGNILCYVELARVLGQERPIVGIQASGLQGEHAPLNRVETLAERYVTAVRHYQPQGPYYLGGWSLGGVIAFEMAQQLTAQGQQVAFLALIDSQPYPLSAAPPSELSLLLRFLAELQGEPLEDETAVAAQLQMLTVEEQLAYVATQAETRGLLPPGNAVERIRPLWAVFRANIHALRHYQPKLYNGRLHLYHTSPHTHHWQIFTPHPILSYKLPGNHFTLLHKPHITALAEQLSVGLSANGEERGAKSEERS